MKKKLFLRQYEEIMNTKNPDFKGYIFDDTLSSIIKDGTLTIKPTIDESKNNAPSFNGCEFNTGITIEGFVFEKEDNIFCDCEFNEDVKFRNIKFGDLSIEKAFFRKNLIIFNCDFENGIFFNDVTIEGEFNIEKGVGLKPTNIREARFVCCFKGKVYFNFINFEYINLKRSIFGDRTIMFNHCLIEKLGIFRDLHLKPNVVFNNIDLTNCSFLNSNFEDVKFSSPTIDIENHIDYLFLTNDLEKNINKFKGYGISNLDKMIGEVNESNLSDEYRSFEKNFDRNKNFDLAGLFHQKYFDIKTKFEKGKINKFILYSYKWFSNYGESYTKPLSWFLFLIFAFSVLYLFTGLEYKDGSVIFYLDSGNIYLFLNDIALSLIFSILNSFPVKRDIELVKAANGVTVFFTVFQTAIQSILLTLFVIALRRKFKR